MQEIRQIVVPVDFNQHSDALAEFALYMAKKMDARVTFIHVMNVLDPTDFKADTLKQVEGNFHAYMEKNMADLMAQVPGGAEGCSGEILTGEVADAIITYAKDKAADMIIISTHGAQGIEKVLLGSVADRVIKGAHCPTVVFNPFKGARGYGMCKPLNSCIQPV